MPFLHLFIVNQSGGLILHRPLSNRAPQISTNEWLRMGSTFHSLHAIAAEASPVKLPNNKNSKYAEDGIEVIEANGMILKCLQTRTGVKFVVTAEPGTPDMELCLREIYVLYADYALKNPFYELEMPIRCELFIQGVDQLIEKLHRQAYVRNQHFSEGVGGSGGTGGGIVPSPSSGGGSGTHSSPASIYNAQIKK